MKRLSIQIFHIFLGLSLAAGFYACQSSTEDHHAEDDHDHAHSHEGEDDHDHEEEDENIATLTAVQMQAISLELGSFTKKKLAASIKLNGSLEIPPNNKAEVSSLIPGNIQSIRVKPGQYIKKGGLLATISNQEIINIQQALLETEGALLFLEKEYARQEQLAEEDVVAKKKFEKVASEYKIALSRKKALEAKVKLLGISLNRSAESLTTTIPIRSPISGYIKEINVSIGSHVDMVSPLFEIVDNHHIHIDLRAYEKDLPHLFIGQKLSFSLQSAPAKVYEAKIFALGKALSESSRTTTVHAEIIQEVSHLLPGMFVEARINMDEQEVNSLPESAIVRDRGLEYIFLLEKEEEGESAFRKVQVVSGTSDLGFTAIEPMEEVAPDARVVTKGAFYLMAQTKKGEEGAGHHH